MREDFRISAPGAAPCADVEDGPAGELRNQWAINSAPKMASVITLSPATVASRNQPRPTTATMASLRAVLERMPVTSARAAVATERTTARCARAIA